MEDRIRNAINEFNLYSSNFDLNNPKLKLKYDHTFRVVAYAKDIAKSENLNEEDSYLAFVCALLHDIARFNQYTEYGTYIDKLSFDHGDKGYEILKENDYISKYVENDDDKLLVLKAVKNHNKFEIEDGLSEREMYFAKLVRDADKIDIMDLQQNDIKDGNYEVPEEAINAMKEKRCMIRTKIERTDITYVLVYICFIYDINFKRSFEIISEKKIIEKKLDVLKKYIKTEDYEVIEKLISGQIAIDN